MQTLIAEFEYDRSFIGIIIIIISGMISGFLFTAAGYLNQFQNAVTLSMAIICDAFFIYGILLMRKKLFGINTISILHNEIIIPKKGLSTGTIYIPYSDIKFTDDVFVKSRRKLEFLFHHNSYKTLMLDSNYFDSNSKYIQFLQHLSTKIKVITNETFKPEIKNIDKINQEEHLKKILRQIDNSELTENDKQKAKADVFKVVHSYDEVKEKLSEVLKEKDNLFLDMKKTTKMRLKYINLFISILFVIVFLYFFFVKVFST